MNNDVTPEEVNTMAKKDDGRREIKISAIAGGIAGLVCLAGFAILAFRRSRVHRVRVTTTSTDVVVFALLGALIVIGDLLTFGYNVFGSGYFSTAAATGPATTCVRGRRPCRPCGRAGRAPRCPRR